MLNELRELVLAFSLAGLGYTYLGYPALMWLLSRRRPRPSLHIHGDAHPSVSLIVVAQDEAACIGGRIENMLALDYPSERLQIIVASDGSSDSTVAEARRAGGDRVLTLALHVPRGKPAALNQAVEHATGDILVFSDARQRFASNALLALTAAFADPRVGAVSGELDLRPSTRLGTASRGNGFYWRYEKFIRDCESRVDSTIGATGAIYAIRHALFTDIPNDTLLDDVWIPCLATARGFRVLFEPAAKAYDVVNGDPKREFRRKVRTIAGTFQLFWRQPWLLDPTKNRLWLQTVSHKALRLLSPLFLATLLVTTLLPPSSRLERGLASSELLLFAAALVGRTFPRAGRAFSVAYVFCLLNWATVVAAFRFVAGRTQVTWKKEHHYVRHRRLRWK